jgi:UDP-N-acetylglucosamine 2-epimerase (non-hydrolysing)
MRRAVAIFGTRPEAIKLAPIILGFDGDLDVELLTCTTGQHREMLDQVLQDFEITPSTSLDVMRPCQTLAMLTSRMVEEIDKVVTKLHPDIILVQGDTTSAFCASLVGFYNRIPIAHVEAGLRTGNLQAPWPEEANRVMITRLASLHFAPTELAVRNLLNEGISNEAITLTGNTVIDALLHAVERANQLKPFVPGLPAHLLDDGSPLVLVTGHRRENFGEGLRQICMAIAELSQQFPEVHFVYPVHLNPNVRQPVWEILGRHAQHGNVHLIEPLAYLPFVRLLNASTLVLTDSGGIQEEAPSLGKPTLVMRESTERPEAVAAGSARLIGTATDKIISNVAMLLTNDGLRQQMSSVSNPFGDGRATQRIVARCRQFLGLDGGMTQSPRIAHSHFKEE